MSDIDLHDGKMASVTGLGRDIFVKLKYTGSGATLAAGEELVSKLHAYLGVAIASDNSIREDLKLQPINRGPNMAQIKLKLAETVDGPQLQQLVEHFIQEAVESGYDHSKAAKPVAASSAGLSGAIDTEKMNRAVEEALEFGQYGLGRIGAYFYSQTSTNVDILRENARKMLKDGDIVVSEPGGQAKLVDQLVRKALDFVQSEAFLAQMRSV